MLLLRFCENGDFKFFKSKFDLIFLILQFHNRKKKFRWNLWFLEFFVSISWKQHHAPFYFKSELCLIQLKITVGSVFFHSRQCESLSETDYPTVNEAVKIVQNNL